MYTEDYYKTVNYTDYLSRYKKYLKTAEDLARLGKELTLFDKHSRILDYGAGVGHLVSAFGSLDYNIMGYDISEWACTYAATKGAYVVNTLPNTEYPYHAFDVMIALDVFEHIQDKDIIKDFKELTVLPKVLIFRIPVKQYKDQKVFHLEVSRRDPTHINCKTREGWKNLLKEIGYSIFLSLDLPTIYDAEGVYCGLALA